MTVYEAIAALVQYGIDTGLTPECERIYTTNQLLEVMQLDDYEEPGRNDSSTVRGNFRCAACRCMQSWTDTGQRSVP